MDGQKTTTLATTPFVWWGKKWVIVIGDDFLRWELWLLEDNYTYIRRFRSSWWVLPYQKEPPWIPWSTGLEGCTSTCWCCWSSRFAFWHPEKPGQNWKKNNFGTRGVGVFRMGHAEVLTFMTLPFLLNLGWIPKEVSFQKVPFFVHFWTHSLFF